MSATTNREDTTMISTEYRGQETYLQNEALARARTLQLARRLGRRAERTALRTRLGLARRI